MHSMHNSSVCCDLMTATCIYMQVKKKDVPVSGSESVEMEEDGAGSDGGDSPSSLQLTPADGECVLLYTVNTTHCTHYCDSDTCL